MWVVYEKKTVQKELKKAPQEILLRYEAWKRIVELSGPQGLKLIKGFHDEGLKGQWQGFRSSRLNYQWRLIYKLEKELFEVYVIEITPHKY
jgi:addiction module RelE/StbE family toxin